MNEATRFEDFADAGRRLADELARPGAPALDEPVVIGIGDEGTAVARALAERLGAPLVEVKVARLGLPWRPDLPFGAVTEDDHHYVDPEIAADVSLGAREIAQIARAELARLHEQASTRDSWPPLAGRTAVVVSHALSTGYRALALFASLRAAGAASIIAAAPCAAADAAERVSSAADRAVFLAVHDGPRFAPADFYAALAAS